jgi:hypothetical protein
VPGRRAGFSDDRIDKGHRQEATTARAARADATTFLLFAVMARECGMTPARDIRMHTRLF